MRKSETLLSVTLLSSVGMSTWLWVELRDERLRNIELSARIRPATAASGDAGETAMSQTTSVATSSPTPTPPTEAAANRSTQVVESQREDSESHIRRMLHDPQYREAWRAQMRLSYSLRRENVIRLLGFTPEEADAIVELELDRQLRWIDRTPLDPEEDEPEQQAKLGELLGEEKRARFEEYMESRPTRMLVDRYRTQFTGADTLRDEQVEPLISALQLPNQQMLQQLREYRDQLTSEESPDSSRQFSERQLELMKEFHDRMHTAASPILSRSQLERLDALLKRELERQEAELRMQRVQSNAN